MPNPLTVELSDLALNGAMALRSNPPPQADLPLRGITVLAVEDSRFASEALRLMCRRLGARLRRADTLHAARSHLRLYRPDLVIVDLGLPDGRGEVLLREIAAQQGHRPVLLGTSGDTGGRGDALAAGAQGFIDKPFENFAAFRSAMLRYLPDLAANRPNGANTGYPVLASGAAYASSDAPITPDALALRDDLAHAAAMIEAGHDHVDQRYLAGFLSGVAAHSHDTALAEAAANAGAAPLASGLDHLHRMLSRRLEGHSNAFGPAAGS